MGAVGGKGSWRGIVSKEPLNGARWVERRSYIPTHAVKLKGEPMAGGWTRDGAVQDQIDATVEDAVKRMRADQARASLIECEECGEPIPQARRAAVPGVRRCVACQAGADKRRTAFSGYNRRGSKDSQLR